MTRHHSDTTLDAVVEAPRLPEFAADWAFFLDVDGTLAHIAREPGAVTIEAAVLDAVGRLYRATGGALALITGRAIGDVDRLFAPLRLPAAGQHGIERRAASGVLERDAAVAEKLDAARAALGEFAAAHPGLTFEDKGETLALHYRRAPETRPLARRFVDAQLEALDSGFVLQPGKMVFEIRPGGKDKGTAIGAFMREPPFAGLTPVFIGDDKTDEDGFRVINRLGGHSIKVGNGSTAARWRLDDAGGVLAWLRRCADFIERAGTSGLSK